MNFSHRFFRKKNTFLTHEPYSTQIEHVHSRKNNPSVSLPLTAYLLIRNLDLRFSCKISHRPILQNPRRGREQHQCEICTIKVLLFINPLFPFKKNQAPPQKSSSRKNKKSKQKKKGGGGFRRFRGSLQSAFYDVFLKKASDWPWGNWHRQYQ